MTPNASAGLRQGLLAGWVLAALAAGLAAQPEQPVPRGRLFSLQRSQDDIHELGQAREDVRAGRLAEAVELLQRLLDRGRQGVVPVDTDGNRFAGLRHAVIETLRDLPQAGRDAYERLVEREAGSLVQTAMEARTPAALQAVARRWPTSSLGRRARLLLGDLALEAGRANEALWHFRAAQDATPREDALLAELEQRLVAARALNLDFRPAPTTPALPAAGVQTLAEDVATVVPGSRESRRLLRGWPAYAQTDGFDTMPVPIGKPVRQSRDTYKPPGYASLTSFGGHAVGGLLGVYVNDGYSVRAYDPLRTPSEAWTWSGPMQADDDGRPDFDSEMTLNADMVLSCAIGDDVVVAALQVPTEGESVVFRAQVPVIQKIPARRLFALDRHTGKLRWFHFDQMGGIVTQRYSGHDVCGPPLVQDDVVYVATHDQTGAIAFYLSAYDLNSGRPKWRRLICSSQQEVNMFGNARFEFAASPLTLHDGVLYGVTNLGVAFATDAADGEVRWISAYPVIEMPPTRLTQQQPREVYFGNSPPAVAAGVVAVTPLDSETAVGFDVHTGRTLWRMNHRAVTRSDGQTENHVRWLLGAIGDEFFFSGRGLVAVRARGRGTGQLLADVRQVVQPERLQLSMEPSVYGTPQCPRGAIAGERLWIPANDSVQVFDKDGNKPERGDALSHLQPPFGNLLLSDGLVVSMRSPWLEIAFDRDALTQASRARLERSRDDPHAWLAHGLMLRAAAGDRVDGPEAERAEQAFQSGLEAAQRAGIGRQSRVCRRLASGAFELNLARALALGPARRHDAVQMLRRARDAAPSGADWLRAQEHVLTLLREQPKEFTDELQHARRRYGELMHAFRDGTATVTVWTLWQAALYSPPPQAMAAAQELVVRHTGDALGGENVRERAQRRQLELLKEHGEALYAPIEAEAGAELAAAGEDTERLRGLGSRYPFSKAARVASLRLLDLAVARGDLGAAARSFAQTLHEASPSAGALRRMLEAARRGGNEALAAALGARLTSGHAAAASDFPPDAGRRFGEAVAGLGLAQPPPVVPVRPGELPVRIVAQLAPDATHSTGVVRLARVPAGFLAPEQRLLYVTRGNRLEGYDLAASEPLREPLFATAHDSNADQQPFWLCGELLLVHENKRLRALHHRSGEERWGYDAEPRFVLQCLGVHGGVAAVFAQPEDGGDGALLLGLEPLTGTLLYRRALTAPDGAQVLPGGGWLWQVDVRGQRVHRFDPVTGTTERTVPIPPEAANRLGMRTRGLRSFRHDLAQLFATDDTLWLTFEGHLSTGAPPAIVALDFDGTQRWQWTGGRNRLLRLAGLGPRNQVVALESGEQDGALVLLDARTGIVRGAPRELSGRARCQNASPWTPLPEPLIVYEPGVAQAITVFSLEGGPSFRHPLPEQMDLVVPGGSVLGASFLAVLGTQQQSDTNARLGMHVVGLPDRESRLPEGRMLMPLPLSSNSRMVTVEGRILVQSANRLVLLGEGPAIDATEGPEPGGEPPRRSRRRR